MNERIQELAKQCNFTDLDIEQLNPGFEKFAELIVRECGQFIIDTYDFSGDENYMADRMKEHFGVSDE